VDVLKLVCVGVPVSAPIVDLPNLGADRIGLSPSEPTASRSAS
jgi:hypothetical protein